MFCPSIREAERRAARATDLRAASRLWPLHCPAHHAAPRPSREARTIASHLWRRPRHHGDSRGRAYRRRRRQMLRLRHGGPRDRSRRGSARRSRLLRQSLGEPGGCGRGSGRRRADPRHRTNHGGLRSLAESRWSSRSDLRHIPARTLATSTPSGLGLDAQAG